MSFIGCLKISDSCNFLTLSLNPIKKGHCLSDSVKKLQLSEIFKHPIKNDLFLSLPINITEIFPG